MTTHFRAARDITMGVICAIILAWLLFVGSYNHFEAQAEEANSEEHQGQ